MVRRPTSPSRLPGSTSGPSTYLWSHVGEVGTIPDTLSLKLGHWHRKLSKMAASSPATTRARL